MSRTLSELTAGQSVYADTLSSGETITSEFIYLGESDDGNAGLLLWAVLPYSGKMHASNVAEYQTCDQRAYLIGDFITDYLPTALQNCLVSSQYSYYSTDNAGLITLTDPVRLLTYEECGYATTYGEGPSRLSALMTWAGTTTANTARIAYNSSGAAVYWWLASSYSSTQFRFVYAVGSASASNASNSYYIRPVLSVSLDTIVSDETEDTIYLYPDEAKTYRELSATVYLGSTANRPKQARVTIPVTNLYDTTIQVSNNAKDTSPVWVDVENDAVATLNNETKETDEWELGVKFYGKSNGFGYIGEPVVMTEEES